MLHETGLSFVSIKGPAESWGFFLAFSRNANENSQFFALFRKKAVSVWMGIAGCSIG